MPDGSFMVDLAELDAAITGVSAERDAIQAQVTRVRATFDDVEAHWKSPSGTSFATLAVQFNGLATDLVSLLGDAVDRMRTAYTNYANTESVNTGNYS